MSDFDLRKFLAEQKAPKQENIQEVEVNEEELDELRPGYAVGEMSPENNALLKALETLGSKAGAAGKKIAAWAKDNIELGKMSDAMKEEEMEETYHEEEANEGDMDESVIAGIAALIGSSLAAGKVLDWIQSKYPEAVEKFVKGAEAGMRGSGKLEEELDEAETSEEVNEETLNEIGPEALEMLQGLAGAGALIGGSAALNSWLEKAEAGKYGDKVANAVKKLRAGAKGASKAVNPGGTQPGSAVGENTNEELKENAFKASIKEILNS